MQLNDFIRAVKGDLSRVLDQSGRMLYSSTKTLRPGDVYLLGLNPGRDPGGIDGRTLGDNLDSLLDETADSSLSGYWDQSKPGKDTLQRRVVWLLENLGYSPRDVCASNLIFMRSAGEEDCGYPQSADICWPVHERILKIVQPKIILCFGYKPLDYLLRLPGSAAPLESHPSGHGGWECRATRKGVAGQLVTIVTVPHLRRYDIIGHPSVVDWIKNKIAGYSQSTSQFDTPPRADADAVGESVAFQKPESGPSAQERRPRRDDSDIPYESRVYRTGKPYTSRGRHRTEIWQCGWYDGCTIREFLARASAVGGHPEDVRIYWHLGVIRLDPPPRPGQLREPR